ncbi:MAG: LysR substrate-binding domain-containing protein [Myxococcota bacterium]
MELKQFEYFRAVAEELHFRRAARRLHISQPALSHQVKRIEEEIGAVLLERSRAGVALTPAGAVLLEHAHRVLRAAANAIDATKAAAQTGPGRLRIGLIDYVNLDVIVRSIVRLRAAHPNADIQQLAVPSAEVWAGLVERTLDVGFGPAPVVGDDLIMRTIAEGRWLAVVRRQHPWAERTSLDLTALHRQPIVFFDASLNPALHAAWTERFSEAGVEPVIVYDTKQVHTGLQMARQQDVAYLVASYIVEPLPDGLVGVPLTGFDSAIRVVAAWRRTDRSPLLAAYLEGLRT